MKHVAEAVMLIAVLVFIFGLVYLSHNNWHF